MRTLESLSWLWILVGFVGAIAVIIGVWGEGWAEGRVLPYHKQESLKKWFWRILLIGLAFDLVGLMGSTATSAALGSRVEELRKQNDEFEFNQIPLSMSFNESLFLNELGGKPTGAVHILYPKKILAHIA